MAHLPTLEAESAPKEVVEVYNDFQRRMGFPEAPNFIKTQGHSLAAARGTWALVKNVLVGGLLPRTLKEMMFVAISQDRDCRYCEAAHLACCRMLGIEPTALEALVANVVDIAPPKVRDIIRTQVLACLQGLTEADFEGCGVTDWHNPRSWRSSPWRRSRSTPTPSPTRPGCRPTTCSRSSDARDRRHRAAQRAHRAILGMHAGVSISRRSLRVAAGRLRWVVDYDRCTFALTRAKRGASAGPRRAPGSGLSRQELAEVPEAERTLVERVLDFRRAAGAPPSAIGLPVRWRVERSARSARSTRAPIRIET